MNIKSIWQITSAKASEVTTLQRDTNACIIIITVLTLHCLLSLNYLGTKMYRE